MWQGKNKAITFSYDDGVIQDKRLAELFDKYSLKGTFNFNSEGTRKFNFTKEEPLAATKTGNLIVFNNLSNDFQIDILLDIDQQGNN